MSTLVVLNRFDGGMVNDARDTRANVCRICTHFDNLTNPHKLTPYRTAETGDSDAATQQIANFEIVDGVQYGLGTATSGTLIPKLYTRSDFTGATWTADAGGYSISGSARADADIPFFTHYKTTGKIYGVRAGRYVWSVIPATSANTTEADLTAYSHVSNGVVHPNDDCLYVGYDNKIARNNNGSWETPALTLPSDYIVTQVRPYGNFLAIFARHASGLHSKLWLWDRDSSLVTVSESVDWGEGNVMIGEEDNGELIGVSFVGDTGSSAIKSRVTVKRYSGGSVTDVEQLVGFSQSPAIGSTLYCRKANGRIEFAANIPVGDTSYCGIWGIGRRATGELVVTLEREYSTVTSTTAPYGFIHIGDYVFASYSNSATFAMDKTNDSASFTQTSVRETTINPGMPAIDGDKSKQLAAVALSTEPLTSGQQAVLKYRVDGGSWTTVMTITTVGATVTEQPFDANGDPFEAGREIEFRIESTGGAEITGLSYRYNKLATAL